MRKIGLFMAMVLVMPLFTLAAGEKVSTFLQKVLEWIGLAGKIIMAGTVVAFFYGLFLFVFNPDKQEEGKKTMGWGIVALTVMVSIWGLVSLLQNTLGIDSTDSIDMPKIPGIDS